MDLVQPNRPSGGATLGRGGTAAPATGELALDPRNPSSLTTAARSGGHEQATRAAQEQGGRSWAAGEWTISPLC
jgi:hypothetical protein